MAKKLAGKRWFEALGQREWAMHRTHWLGGYRQNWPQWAKDAYSDGTGAGFFPAPKMLLQALEHPNGEV